MQEQRVDGACAGAKVIVADDDDELRELVVETLRGDGCRVIEARDGAELLTLLSDTLAGKDAWPDVVLTDVCMPKLSGLGVLAALRRANRSLSVVMMTGFPPDSVQIVARRLGAVGVLQKPFRAEELLHAVRTACGGRPATVPA